MRKILRYLLIVVVIIGIIWVVIYFLTRTGSQAGQTGSLPLQSGSLPSANSGAFGNSTSGSLTNNGVVVNNSNGGSVGATVNFNIISTSENAIDYFIDAHNNATIIELGGEITTVSNNNTNTISSLGISNIISTGFSYDGAKLFVNFGDLNNPQTSVFDINTKSWTPLPAGMVSPRWSPMDYRIAYLKNNSDGTETLTTIDTSKIKNNSTVITTLHIQDVSLLWLLKNKFLFYDKPSTYTQGSIWSFDLQKKSLTPITIDQSGVEATWSNATTTMGVEFVSSVSEYGGQLELIDGSGNKIEQFKSLTLPQKCLFNPYTAPGAPTTTIQNATTTSSIINSSYLALYCGIPRDQNALSSNKLPDSYNQMALFTSDNIYRINTSNGNVDVLFNDQSQNMDVSNLKIFNNSLFFINRYDQKLYSLGL